MYAMQVNKLLGRTLRAEGKGILQMKKCLIVFLLILIVSNIFADNPFVVIMYDSKTEKSIGPFPPKRTVWASTIEKVINLNAKAVVMKFFYDLPKDEDKILSSSLKKVPTFLQACINEVEPSDNKLDVKFTIKLDQNYKNLITGKKGWMPVSELANNAYDIGFVDIRDINNIPIIEKYDNKYVKSLYFSILQFIFPNLRLENNSLVNNNKKILLNQYSEMHINYPKEDNLDYISLCDVLNNKIDKAKIENKIVIIGFDGNDLDSFDISTGKVRKHRVFIYGLYDMYNQINQ
jgi:CHASE2 domain-containing sensor protein